jgi:hypothetical protein
MKMKKKQKTMQRAAFVILTAALLAFLSVGMVSAYGWKSSVPASHGGGMHSSYGYAGGHGAWHASGPIHMRGHMTGYGAGSGYGHHPGMHETGRNHMGW